MPLSITALIHSTKIPPLIDVPTYSLATIDSEGKTNMNIVTYTTPVSISPDRIWCVGLVKSSLSHQNFMNNDFGILQLLCPKHSSLVKLLGGSSGRDVDKQSECRERGFKWQYLAIDKDDDEDDIKYLPLVLPDCTYYLLLNRIHVVDGGSHDVFICNVETMWTTFRNEELEDNADEDDSYLSTRKLRNLGLITKQGRVSDD